MHGVYGELHSIVAIEYSGAKKGLYRFCADLL